MKMSIQKLSLGILLTLLLMVLVPAIQAQTVDGKEVTVIYQTTFSNDPKWTTNNPSTNYWDPTLGMYHFSIEPSTGGYAYTDVDYSEGPFILEYDVILQRIDDAATFRMGLAGSEMDPLKGPNVLSLFTNAKYGKIMWLHVVTNGNKIIETNSQHAANEMGTNAYNGPTANYDLNKTYHITLDYDNDRNVVSMKVAERVTGTVVWSYYVNTWENLRGMKKLYLGSKGDYGQMNIYAVGYIDNVRLSVPVKESITPTETIASSFTTAIQTPKPTTRQTTALPTPYPTDTAKSPSSVILAIGSIGVIAICSGLSRMKRNR
jgi:hypothetical protein